MKNIFNMNQNKYISKRFLVLLMVLCCGISQAWAQNFDFSAVCSTGQTLYYKITDNTNHYVMVVAPGSNSYSGWNNYTKPTGNMEIPGVVSYNDFDYTVIRIYDYAFYGCSD